MTGSMRSIVKARQGPGLEMVEADIPEINDDQVLIKIKATSICGTDVHIYNWDAWAQARITPPLRLGHEFCGHVAAVGRNIRNFRKATLSPPTATSPTAPARFAARARPTSAPTCRSSAWTAPAAFADYIALPEISLWKNDPDLDPAQASIQDPMGNAVYTCLAEPVAGRSVIVFGDGPTGLGAVGVAKAAGASTVFHVGKYPARLDIGRRMGADVTIDIADPAVDVASRCWTPPAVGASMSSWR